MTSLDTVVNSPPVQEYLKALEKARPLSVRLLGRGNLARIFGNDNFVDSTIPGVQIPALYAVTKLLAGNKGASILYAAPSYGLGMKMIAEAGYTNIRGIDLDEKAVDFCKSQGLSADVRDAADTGFRPNSFDMVVSRDFVASSYLKSHDKLVGILNELHWIIKPGGFVVFTTMWPESVINMPVEAIDASAFKGSVRIADAIRLTVPKGTEVGTRGKAMYYILAYRKS